MDKSEKQSDIMSPSRGNRESLRIPSFILSSWCKSFSIAIVIYTSALAYYRRTCTSKCLSRESTAAAAIIYKACASCTPPATYSPLVELEKRDSDSSTTNCARGDAYRNGTRVYGKLTEYYEDFLLYICFIFIFLSLSFSCLLCKKL